jgi:prepilin-type N-terminal cleavage/methylation domain-containing protein
MTNRRSLRIGKGPKTKRRRSATSPRAFGRRRESEAGFTLVELLIVVTILPLIVGALSVGLISVFSLQSGVSTRLSHTADAQAVSANFAKDIQGASVVSTEASTNVQCGSVPGSTQLLELESNLDVATGFYQNVTSYVRLPVAATATTPVTYQLVRVYCTGDGTSANVAVASQSTLSNDLNLNSVPCIQLVNTTTCSTTTDASSGWLLAKGISQVQFSINDSQSAGSTGNYPYVLAGSPVASLSTPTLDQPTAPPTDTSCNYASPGSGALANYLCFVDFSNLSGAALLAAQNGGCDEMSVSLPNDYTLFFCLNISGASALPWYLPTYPQAFLGNTSGGIPFYTGIQGDPAIYQRAGGTTTLTFTKIKVVSPANISATGWEVVSLDAESTDQGESITWTSDQNLFVLNDGETGQIQPVGNQCQNNGTSGLTNTPGLTGNGTTTVVCSGGSTETSSSKTGTAMVYAAQPSTLTITMVGTGLEAVTFGMLL